MKIILFFTLLIFNLQIQASCKITSYAHIIKINSVMDGSIIKNSTCSQEINNQFIQLIEVADGTLSTVNLKGYLSKIANSYDIALSPASIHVQSLASLLQDSFKNKLNIITNITSLYGKSALTNNQFINPKFECQSCETAGSKNVKMTIGKKNQWLSVQLSNQVTVYKAVRSLPRQTPLLVHNDFKTAKTITKYKNNFFTDIKNIRFYKLNKNISPNQILKTSDLTSKTLISYGQKVQVLLKINNVSLKTVALAQKSGKIGDYINLKNPKTNKILVGRVSDFNKVVIEL